MYVYIIMSANVAKFVFVGERLCTTDGVNAGK